VSADRPLAVAGIQARMGSTRLPGKSLMDLAGKPLVHRVWERVRRAELVDRVLVLTSTDPSDDPLAAYLEDAGIPYRRGSLDDVLQRYLDLVADFDPHYVVRVTGDCPLVSGELIDVQLEALCAHDADVTRVAGGGAEGTLGGQGVLSARVLRRAAGSPDPRDREHVGSFFLARNGARIDTVELRLDPALRRDDVRLHVDEARDLELLRRIYERFAPADGGACTATLAEVIAWLDANPEVAGLNAAVRESADNRDARALGAEVFPNVVGTWPPDAVHVEAGGSLTGGATP